VKAGVPGACTVEVRKQGTKKRGFDISFKAGRLGHGVALFFVEPPSIATRNPIIVDQNMVITVHPGLAREDDFFKPRRMFW
jgi:Xaa-Pro aminopeptidase